MFSHGKANAALAAAIVFLFLSSCAAYLAFARLHTSQDWVQHTREVQLALHQFASTETQAARLRAEYVDSGDPVLLTRQADTVVNVRNALASIQRLISDNTNQQANFRKLQDLAEQRIALMSRTIELKKSGKSTLELQAPMQREIVLLGDDMGRVLQQMDEHEQALLAQREIREEQSFEITAGILASSLFLALVLFLIHHQLLTDQVRERQQAENAQRALSARLLTLQDEERRKFARELHDSVGQQLAALKMGISMLQSKIPENTMIQECLGLLDDTIAETRTISHLLHPPLLDEAGLNSAFRWFVEGFAKRSGIEVKLDVDQKLARLSDAVELVLFRVLQESLTNVHRHSGAKRADVSLNTSGQNVILKIIDYGNGIPHDVLQDLRETGTGAGVGLAGMTERVREIGGRLQINSTVAGTEIIARVPRLIRTKAPDPISSIEQQVNP